MFMNAQPIWAEGKACEKNAYVVFETKFQMVEKTELHVAGTVFYRIFVNDKFLAFGPARTAKGYVREDVFSLEAFAEIGETVTITIEAMGYYCRSVSTAFQPSAFLAEVQASACVLAYTGRDFKAYQPKCRVQEAERYSIHRHFCEVWDYRKTSSLTEERFLVKTELSKEKLQVLNRIVPYPNYEKKQLGQVVIKGEYFFDETRSYKSSRYPWEIPDWWGRFEWDEILYHPYEWIQRQKQVILDRNKKLPLILSQGDYVVFDLGQLEVGFIQTTLKALKESDIVIGFSEYYHGEEFKLPNMDVHNVIEYLLEKGDEREAESFEPYAFRFVMLAVKSGCVELGAFGVRTYMFDTSGITQADYGDEVLNVVNNAAVRTFAHNAVDVYTDCPSRERAGWLCDSYFTARAEYAMTGKTTIEDAFLENYVIYKNEGELPEGMLPEAYPSDVRPGPEFIPQWTLWYILQVKEYVFRRGHEGEAWCFRKSIDDLFAWFRQYENEDGLLERLPSRNFIEWSKANQWTWDVNYPTNFLYSKALECAYELYGDLKYKEHSDRVRETAIKQSFNGKYFVDHAVRDADGKLQVLEDCSETCQYYAVLLADVDVNEKKYEYLKYLILNEFSASEAREDSKFVAVNAFIGAYLRMDVLLQLEEFELVLEDVKAFFGNMAKYTGTLWENRQFEGSYDHGFASYAYVVIAEAVKGKETN